MIGQLTRRSLFVQVTTSLTLWGELLGLKSFQDTPKTPPKNISQEHLPRTPPRTPPYEAPTAIAVPSADLQPSRWLPSLAPCSLGNCSCYWVERLRRQVCVFFGSWAFHCGLSKHLCSKACRSIFSTRAPEGFGFRIWPSWIIGLGGVNIGSGFRV